MSLIANHPQVSHSLYCGKCKSSAHGVIQRTSAVFYFIHRKDEFMPLKRQLRSRGQPIILQKKKIFRVTSFKGNAQNDNHEGGDTSPKLSKSKVQLPCSHQNRGGDILSESLDVQKHPLSYAAEERGDGTVGSMAIKKLFRKWLLILQTQTSSDIANENLKEEPVQGTDSASQDQHESKSSNATRMLKVALMYFVGFDVAISIPLLVFVPWYLTVRIMYGAEVTNELKPLWVLGPLITALYIKIIQGIFSLYVFLFVQAIRLVKNLPDYSLLVYKYIAEGKLKACLSACFWDPVLRVKNLNYRAFFRRKFKQLEEQAVEAYLDAVESIWPYYCRTIRFLKKANLI